MAVSKTYNVFDLKQKAKRYGVTLNTYMYGVLMKALYDYSDGKEPMPCLVAVPTSTRKEFSNA